MPANRRGELEMNSWLFLDSGVVGYETNMAFDEALLEAMPRLNRPVLRFYGWREPAASFGYFQKYADVERLTTLRPLVRRPTAGGIVPHDADWTYSLAFPVAHEWYALTARQSYRRVHEWIQAAFASLQFACELAPHARKSAVGQCFVGYEESDLLRAGRKIAGAAQRRNRDGLLVQGSVQARSLPMARADWQQSMLAVGSQNWRVNWSPLDPDEALQRRFQELAAKKYSEASYNRKR